MFKQLISTITGSLTQSSFTSPGANGINIPPRAVAKNFFNSVLSSLGAQQGFYGAPGTPAAGIGGGIGVNQGFGQGFGVQNFGAVNAFRSAQGQGNKRGRALAPGSFVNNISTAPLQNNQGFAPQQFGGAPLQGFAGQGGFTAPGAIPGQFGGGSIGFQNTQALQQTNSKGGFLPLLIMPFIGLVTMIGSIFKIKKFSNSFKPVEIDKNTGYNQYQSYLDELYTGRGSFDVEPEFDLERNNFDGFDYEQVQDF